MARMQEGDLSIQLPVHSYDETGRMTGTFNAMSAHLRELVRALQGHAARVTSGAGRLSTSAEQVSGATQQLAKSSRVQREASEEVVFAVTQLQATVVQVRASVDAMIDGGREAASMVRDTGRRAQLLHHLLQEVAKGSDAALQGPLREGAAQAESMIQAMAHVNEALGAIESVGGEIHKATEAQSEVSHEVSRRMQASQAATGEVQLAAAQLANTAPEVALTTRDLVSVAQSLKTAAAAFRVE
jgi:methyl-accepting chemotaxis protein